MAQQADAKTVLTYLESLDYPATKAEVVAEAEREGAPEEVLASVRALALADYRSRDEIIRAIGEPERHTTTGTSPSA